MSCSQSPVPLLVISYLSIYLSINLYIRISVYPRTRKGEQSRQRQRQREEVKSTTRLDMRIVDHAMLT